jgi:hypothetical protein
MIDKRIVYKNDLGGVSVVIPSPKFKGTINELAEKDVPSGLPFLIINASEVPRDREDRDFWEIDISKPDGYGGKNG